MKISHFIKNAELDFSPYKELQNKFPSINIFPGVDEYGEKRTMQSLYLDGMDEDDGEIIFTADLTQYENEIKFLEYEYDDRLISIFILTKIRYRSQKIEIPIHYKKNRLRVFKNQGKKIIYCNPEKKLKEYGFSDNLICKFQKYIILQLSEEIFKSEFEINSFPPEIFSKLVWV